MRYQGTSLCLPYDIRDTLSVNGIELGPQQSERSDSGLLMPFLFLLLLVFFISWPDFINFSTKGSGAEAAPWMIALGAGLLLGALAQRSQFCITGSIRDIFLVGLRSYLPWGLGIFMISACEHDNHIPNLNKKKGTPSSAGPFFVDGIMGC